MSRIPVYVGLDYHSRAVQVCIEDEGGQVLINRPCDNDWRAIAAEVDRLGPDHEVVGCAIEACCGAADLGEKLVREAGWPVDLAHPGYVARMKQNPDKHDWGDARLLADLERVGYVPGVWLAPQEIRELRRLVRHRQALVADRRDVKLRMGALLRDQRVPSPAVRRWTRPWWHWLGCVVALPSESQWLLERYMEQLKWLDQQVSAVEQRLTAVTADDAMVRQLWRLSGVGPVTAWMLRAEIGWFQRFRTGKQLSRFCGLSPRNASSGQRQADAGLIKAGNAQLRAVLIQAAHRLILHHPRWADLAGQLREAGKPTNVIVAAVANRWIRWLYHQMQPKPAAA